MLPELFVIVWQLLVTMSVFRYDIHCNTNISIIHEQDEASEKIKCSNISYTWVAWISTWIFIPILLFEWMFMKMIYFSLVLESLFRSWVMLLYITYMRLVHHLYMYLYDCPSYRYMYIRNFKKIVFVFTITNFIEILIYQTTSSSQNIFVFVWSDN